MKKFASLSDLNASGPESTLNQPILRPSSVMSPQLRHSRAATGNIALNDDGVGKEDGDGESFSACLLIMDDNHRLSEWIGYHYFAMSLRYLVVAVDPHSKTTPSRILNRWRDRMTIVEWTDYNFTKKRLIIDHTNENHGKKKYKHLTRQVDFYHECTRHLQNHNRTWTSYHGKCIFPCFYLMLQMQREELLLPLCCTTHTVLLDVDEFISINSDVVSHAQELFRQPGSILRMVKRYSEPTKSTHHTTLTEKVGSQNDSITVAIEPDYWFKHFQQSCCITLPRVLYGAVESTDEDVAQGVPSIFVKNSKQFDTLPWRFRTTSPRGMSNERKYFS